MDVGCPKCQTEYELDDARVTEEGVTVKCTSCGHVFRVKKKQLVVTLPVKEGASGSPELPPAPPSREWKLRQPSGNIYPCRDLTMLQKWIIEGKVQRDDEISLTGETWKRLGNIPELASFFQIVDDAAKARALEALQKNTPAGGTTGPGGGKITDTWRGGQFSAPAPEPLVPREQLEPETLPPEPPPRKRDTGKLPDFTTPEPPVGQTIQGGRFSSTPPPVTETLQGGRFSAAPAPQQQQPPPPPPPRVARPEPSDEDLRRAVKGGGSGKWILLVLAGLGVGGGVGWYFGVYEPEQKRIAEEQRENARRAEEARVRALEAERAAAAVVLDAAVELEVDAGTLDDAGLPDAGDDAGVDAGVDAGAPDAGSGRDAGPAAPVVTEQKKSFDWYLGRADQLREREQTAAALDLYGKAADLKPDRVEPIAGKGLCLLDMANLSAAEASFLQALSIAPRYGPAIMGLAEAYRMQGKNEKAIEYYQRYLDVLPNGSEAPVARNSIERLKK